MEAEDFHLGARVVASDGKEIGELVHVLVDSDYKLQAAVVKENRAFSGFFLSPGSLLVNDEFILPLDAIKSVDHERVDLSLASTDARRLQAYIGYREKGESVAEEAEDFAAVLGSGPEIPHWVEQVANKSAGELEIDRDENVMLGHTGKKLGIVKDVLFEGDELVGVVLRPDGLFRQEVILPRRFLERSDDAALFAQLDEAAIAGLTPFRPSDA
ncbi:MAG TPA: PRC-barrel domain-containing protein [Candidatus Limnocylindrales bacterium]|nr:PRC-barrel domain-containing protein [Candidatus Limnocylindrales bacterium]